MSYRIQHNQYVSHLTGKTYPFDPKGQNGRESKAAARRALESDDAKVRAAGEQRHGRELSTRELINGVQEPDTRSIRQRVAEEIQHARKPEEPANPYSQRIADLEKQHRFASTAKDKAKIEKRIAVLQAASDQFDTKLGEQRAFEQLLASAPVQKAIAHAQSYLERLLANEQSSEAEIAEARNRLKALQQTGDVKSYQSAFEAAEAAQKNALAQRAADLEAALEQTRTEYGVGSGTSMLVESTALGQSEVEIE
jgi:hypothetical protein